MTDVDSVFIDTNILVYANAADSKFKDRAIAVLKKYEASKIKLCISRQIIREYLVVMSRLMLESNCFDAAKLTSDIIRFQNQFFIAEENIVTTEKLLGLIAKHNITGKAVHDCSIAATIIQYNVKALLTQNVKDFNRYHESFQVIEL